MLDPRLLALAGIIRPGGVVADIGADHGHLICYLIETGIAVRGFACDIGAGPLAAAAKTVAHRGLEDKIELRQTDGLQGLPLEKIDDIVIAGMGGELIAEILAAAPGAKTERLHFILQPMSKAERLRAALYRMGYAIKQEVAVQSGGFVYTVLSAGYTGRCREVDELFAWTGLLPEENSSDSRALLASIARRLTKTAAGLAGTPSGRAQSEQYAGLVRQINRLAERNDHQ
ncbi:MAG: class I SAM-dependent methyltransferase [Oscillospiraceae bacterium]|nr:class I SAM-dependent methyltransferase [Oscillospiraceae bacterium]